MPAKRKIKVSPKILTHAQLLEVDPRYKTFSELPIVRRSTTELFRVERLHWNKKLKPDAKIYPAHVVDGLSYHGARRILGGDLTAVVLVFAHFKKDIYIKPSKLASICDMEVRRIRKLVRRLVRPFCLKCRAKFESCPPGSHQWIAPLYGKVFVKGRTEFVSNVAGWEPFLSEMFRRDREEKQQADEGRVRTKESRRENVELARSQKRPK